jgi:hypothetical protein
VILCAVLLFVAKRLRVPVFFAATASQANIGGPVSAPVVAAAYQPNLAVVGLLMAIIGNILGTFAGLFVVAPMAHCYEPGEVVDDTPRAWREDFRFDKSKPFCAVTASFSVALSAAERQIFT